MSDTGFERDKIVVNGCTGGCCEAFTLGFTPEDLMAMKKAGHEGKVKWRDHKGCVRRVLHPGDHEIDYIADMLIPVGEYDYEPADGEPLPNVKDLYEQKDLQKLSLLIESVNCFVDSDGQVKVMVWTCKHFDKEKRMCSAYDQRPNMCKHYGRQCKYTGCNFEHTWEMLNKATLTPRGEDIIEEQSH